MNLKEYLKTSTIRPQEGDKVEYMSFQRRMISNVLVNSQRLTPGVGCSYDADVTKLTEEYKKLKSSCGYDLTFNTIMLKILVECLKAAPKLNAHFLYNHFSGNGKLIIKKHIDVSIAINLDNDQTFQVKVMNLEEKDLKETAFLAEEAKRKLRNTKLDDIMFEVARQRIIGLITHGHLLSPISQTITSCFGKGKAINLAKSLKSDFRKLMKKEKIEDGLKMEELNEGTVCFTNWGTLYDDLDVNITYIPPLYPQVFMFGMGRVKNVDFVYKDKEDSLQMGTKKILPLSLIFDHKIGGATDLMPFIKKLDEILKNPEIIHTW
ncbi:MAG: 2-oxo acid dehydrogenase subunit E2 [Clostridia bacterium]|nr:2-oxo acid dehydrogenase subunit E2 [Clostridia bacterium]